MKVVHSSKRHKLGAILLSGLPSCIRSGSRSVQVQSFKIWGISNSAAQCGSAENTSPQHLCHANLKSPTCSMFTEPFLIWS